MRKAKRAGANCGGQEPVGLFGRFGRRVAASAACSAEPAAMLPAVAVRAAAAAGCWAATAGARVAVNAAPGSAGSSSLALLVSSVEIVGVDAGSCGEAVARELAAP